jgi:hypothetical protein
MGLLKKAGEQGSLSRAEVSSVERTGVSRGAGEQEKFFPSAPLPLCPSASVAGVAYGSYARVMLSPIIEQLEKEVNNNSVKAVRLEEEPGLLWQAVELAHSLVSQLKSQQER